MKYEFTGETKTEFGVTLKRIRALVAIERRDVHAGDLGGWIESEENLDQDGNAWVYGDALVSGNARVYGDALVSGNARVYGDALVSGNARVYGDAQVYGNAWVYGDALVSGNARVYGDAQVYGNAWVYGDAWEHSPLYVQGTAHAAYMSTAEKFGIGCQRYTFAGWHRFWKKIAQRNGYTAAQCREYALYFNLACDRYGKQEYKIDVDADGGDGEVDE